YTPGQGFSLMSDDEKYKLTIGAQLQLQYAFLDADTNANGPSASAPDYSKFSLRRAKLLLSGNAFTKDLTYVMNVNFANINGGSTTNGGLLEETYLQYRIINEAQLRFG